MSRTYWVYILASRPGGALYVGVTNNLSARVFAHRERRGSRHTARYAIDRLVYYESYDDVRAAIQRERNLKHWPRAWKVNLINSLNPTWRDLYEELNHSLPSGVMAGLVPAISIGEAERPAERQVLSPSGRDGRDEPGHDKLEAWTRTSDAGTDPDSQPQRPAPAPAGRAP